MSLSNREYQLAFTLLKGMTRPIAEYIINLFGDERSFFDASDYMIAGMAGSKLKFASATLREEALSAAHNEWEYINSTNIKFKYFTDEDYPERLKECEDSPLCIFHTGLLDTDNANCLSIVGTRHATRQGIAFTENLVSELAKKIDNLVIISGLAYGIDIAAHRAALDNEVTTIAVVAHGLNTIYPAVHRNDAAKIVKSGGAIISEYPHDAAIHRANFLARNRIVAGLSDGLVVVESGEKGGALVTAKIAGAYNRDVMAVPGRPADPYSRGCNSLIRANMAGLITSADDVIAQLGWETRADEGNQPELRVNLTQEEEQILSYIRSNGEARLNPMSVSLDIPINRLLPALVNLEFNGMILSAPGARYIPC